MMAPGLCCMGGVAGVSAHPGVNAGLFTPQIHAFLF